MFFLVNETVDDNEDFRLKIDPRKWGVPPRPALEIWQAFDSFFDGFHHCFTTKTCDNTVMAKIYLGGTLTMDTGRNCAGITRKVMGVDESPDALQHFLTNSPWDPQPVYDKIQRQIAGDKDFNGGVLSLDESGDRRNSENCAGASVQYCGRYGKKVICQMGVCLGYYNQGIWSMISSQLYLAKKWFTDEYAQQRKKTGIPENRVFMSKPQMAYQQVLKAVENGIKFEVMVGDSCYGRDGTLRKKYDKMGLTYVLDTSSDATVYLVDPKFREGAIKGNPDSYQHPVTIDGHKAIALKEILELPDTKFQTVKVRNSERGVLKSQFHARRVWVLIQGQHIMEEWLLIRKQKNGKISYSFSNAPADTSLKKLAKWRCYRYFIERIFEDAKSDLGWDEMEACKYRSWDHHTALTALAMWFIASLKLNWKRKYPSDSQMAKDLKVKVLPKLSTKNVRELFRSAFHLGDLSEEESLKLVLQHLQNRTRSTASRLKQEKGIHADSS